MIDSLENRRHLSVTTEYDADKQTLFCTGNDRRDSVLFSRGQAGESLRALVDGVLQTFSEPIQLISISMGAGGDTVILGRIAIPMIVFGGQGPDTISGGLADDTIMGEGGFDYIHGREGDDIISGGLQGDSMLGADGNDTLTSGSDLLGNDDSIFGGKGEDLVDYSASADVARLLIGDASAAPNLISDFIGNDIETIRGTAGNDRIRNATSRGIVIEGLGGDDILTGGSGDDTLVGGEGNDTLMGTGGNDVFDALDSAADMIDGGGGSDVLRTSDDGLDVISTVPSSSSRPSSAKAATAPAKARDTIQRVIYFGCSICRTTLTVEDKLAGKMVKCPTCMSAQRVPADEGAGVATAKSVPTLSATAGARRLPGSMQRTSTARTYGFNCPFCSSRLSANEGQGGADGACPTCGSQITIPILDRYGRLIDPKTREIIRPDPHPVHAYAAAGERAPRVIRVSDGTQHIQCPKCAAPSPITANNCRHCGMPFTMEGTTPDSFGPNNGLCTLSLVIGIISIPGACLIVAAPLAIILGIVGYNQAAKSPDGTGKGMAIGGMACGVAGGLVSAWLYG